MWFRASASKTFSSSSRSFGIIIGIVFGLFVIVFGGVCG